MSALLTRRPAPQSLTPHEKDFVSIRTTVKVHCGCGFATTVVEDGSKHAESTGHTLHITGEIRVS